MLEKQLAEEQKVHKLGEVKVKRDKMKEAEEKNKINKPLTDMEQETIAKNKALKAKAVELTQEQLDDVKQMNKMVAYAKAATIREKQLEEKKRQWENFKIQEKKKDKIMELDRLKNIKEEAVKQEKKKLQALKGREVIVEQIKARQIERLKEKEQQEREAQITIQRMKEL